MRSTSASKLPGAGDATAPWPQSGGAAQSSGRSALTTPSKFDGAPVNPWRSARGSIGKADSGPGHDRRKSGLDAFGESPVDVPCAVGRNRDLHDGATLAPKAHRERALDGGE